MLWSRVDHFKHKFWATGQVFSVFTIRRILYMDGRDLIQNESITFKVFLKGIECKLEAVKEMHRRKQLCMSNLFGVEL